MVTTEANLFNILRYPVSVEFREEDLRRLPEAVLKEWWEWAGNAGIGNPRNRSRIPAIPHRVSSYLNNHTPKFVRKKLYQKLREIISDYDTFEISNNS